ncbi:hypothetical protein NEOLEDRAFT_1131171 [Neolentinus lepideus HHB14362 ss-1]|uniref:Delta-endotoxin CytB n=1 Tax=Neolentinus lepideus HHB14362 ss-1 TaxID=1314782 RepID=A0A165TTR9_9AGAM|nr:hypothetical protein NEOLEDRAFT_1131171 [Neolentinus lepideus HHB14362 ss-1]
MSESRPRPARPQSFNSLSKLPENLVPTAVQVNNFVGHFVHLDANPKYFDWGDFAPAVTQYHRTDLVGVAIDTGNARGVKHCKIKDSDLDVVEIERDDNASDAPDIIPGPFGPIAMPSKGPKEISLDNVLGWVVDTLHDVLHIQIERGELSTTITNVFTNLSWAHDNGFLSSSSNGSNTAWEYRTVYGYPEEGEQSKFLSMVTSVTLSADVGKVSNLLMNTTKAHFSSRIKVAKLKVTEGFHSPIHTEL